MPTLIKGLGALNKADGTNVLLAAYGNDVVNMATGLGYGVNLVNQNDVNFATFLDHVFLQNYGNRPRTFNGTSWVYNNVRRTPYSKYLHPYAERMYLFNVKIPDINQSFESRVFYSDLPSGNNEIQWGIEWGTNGATTQNASRLVSTNAGFRTYGIKVGDPLFIVSGNQIGKYTVARIGGDQILEITGTFKQTESNIQFWVGGNWFDVRTNDNDVGMWLGENSDRLLCFKQDALFRRGAPGSPLQQVKGAPGTSSGRSVVNIGKGMTIYFYGANKDSTGFYLYDGNDFTKISNAVQPFIDGISTSNYGSVVAWSEGSLYRAWIGNLSNSNSSNNAFNVSMTNAVFTYDTITGAASIDPISDQVVASILYRESGKRKTFIANAASKVFETPSGNSFDTANIPFYFETYPYYPRGTDVRSEFTKVRIVSRDANGVGVYFKRWGNPFNVDEDWEPLGTIRGDTTELTFKNKVSEMCGIQFRFEEISTGENTAVIEEIVPYSYSKGARFPELKREL